MYRFEELGDKEEKLKTISGVVYGFCRYHNRRHRLVSNVGRRSSHKGLFKGLTAGKSNDHGEGQRNDGQSWRFGALILAPRAGFEPAT